MSAISQGLTYDMFGAPAGNAYFIKGFLEAPGPMIMTPEFMKSKKMPKRKGNTFVMSRVRQLAPATEMMTEGNYPKPVEFFMEELSGEMNYYGSWTKMTRKARDMSPYNIMQIATEKLRDQWDETGEIINWFTMNSGNHVIYSGTATTRSAIVAPIARKQVRQVTRQLRNSQAQAYLRKGREASNKVGTGPTLAGYAALSHPDIETDLQDINATLPTGYQGTMRWKPIQEYGGGSNEALNEYELGSIHRLVFFGHSRLPVLRGEGATGGTNLVETDNKADVFMVPCFGQYAFCKVGLAGYRGFAKKKNGRNWKKEMAKLGGGEMMTTSLTPTKDDPLAWWFTAGWLDCYAALITNDRWVRRIECAVSLPS